MNPRAIIVEYVSPHKLFIIFSNRQRKLFDLKPYLHYPVYRVLEDERFCCQAFIKQGTVAWNDEIDFDPDLLYLESKIVSQPVS